MSKTTVGAGAVVALAAVLAMGAVAYQDQEPPPGHPSEMIPGLYSVWVTFEYPDETVKYVSAINYTGDGDTWRKFMEDAGGPYHLLQKPDPPEGYQWDHDIYGQFLEDTVVKAISTA